MLQQTLLFVLFAGTLLMPAHGQERECLHFSLLIVCGDKFNIFGAIELKNNHALYTQKLWMHAQRQQ